jgi:hypothetical protein
MSEHWGRAGRRTVVSAGLRRLRTCAAARALAALASACGGSTTDQAAKQASVQNQINQARDAAARDQALRDEVYAPQKQVDHPRTTTVVAAPSPAAAQPVAPAAPAVASGCSSFAAARPGGGTYLATSIQTTAISCQDARAMINSGPQGRVSAGWACPLPGDSSFTSCQRGAQAVSWEIPNGDG